MLRRNNLKKEGPIYLRKKEKIMLNMLLKNGRTFNTSIAKKLKISSQVTGRIRRDLEKKGIIKDYSLELDFGFLGINTFTLVFFNVEGSQEDKLKSDNLISLYNVLGNSTTHIGLYAFRNLRESDNYLYSLVEYSENIKVISSHVFPSEGVICHSSKNLFYNAIKGFLGTSNFQTQKVIERKRLKKLTISEKAVLRALVKNPTKSCKKVADSLTNLKLTPTAIDMIKDKLERQRIIKSYNANLDYEKLGINVLACICVSQKPEVLKYQEFLTEKCRTCPQIIDCYRLNKEAALFCGFQNLNELEQYCKKLRSPTCSDLIKIEHVHIISPRGVIKESFDDLYLKILK